MKKLIFGIWLLTLGNSAFAGGWVSRGVTRNCSQSLEILVKEGSQFIVAISSQGSETLWSATGEGYKEKTTSTQFFRSRTDRPRDLGTFTYDVTLPSVMMSSLPQVHFALSGVSESCFF